MPVMHLAGCLAPGRIVRRAPVLALVAMVAVLALLAGSGAFEGALAQTSPFAGARPRQPPPDVGGVVGWLLAKQAEFYRAMSGSIRAAKVDGTAVWGLLGLSFLYGVFHAAGPGHGKAVISSYLLANEETWRRGVTLSFASALLQALVAVALVGIAALALNATAKSMNDAVRVIEVVSYALIALLGARLTWQKGGAFIRALHERLRPRAGVLAEHIPAQVHLPAPTLAAGAHLHHEHGRHQNAHAEHDHARTLDHAVAHAHSAHDHSAHTHGHHSHATADRLHADAAPGETLHRHDPHDHAHCHDDHCGHSHGPEPGQLAGRGGWRRGLAAIVAVGLRPCSGAILVLVFALAQGLFWAGVASTFVMGIGTAITVAAIATFTVAAKGLAKRIASHRAGGGVLLMRGIEACAALVVLAFGIALLAGYMVTERMI